MKKFIKSVFISFFSFWIIAYFIPAVEYANKLTVLLSASIIYSLTNLLVRPILNLLFLPINLITLGLFRWVTNVIILFLVTILVQNFNIRSFVFPGASFMGFVAPRMEFNLLFSFILVTIFFNILSEMFYHFLK